MEGNAGLFRLLIKGFSILTLNETLLSKQIGTLQFQFLTVLSISQKKSSKVPFMFSQNFFYKVSKYVERCDVF